MRSSRAAIAAALVLFAGQAARAVTCACAPCPLEAGGTCRPERALKGGDASPSGSQPSCCGETEPKPVESCSCAHFSSPEGVPAQIDAAASAPTLVAAIPAVAAFDDFQEVVSITPRGPGPPSRAVPLFLRDLSLRL